MSGSSERIERYQVISVNEEQQLVYIRFNGNDLSIKWEPRFGKFPKVGEKLKITMGGYSIHRRIKKIERCGHVQSRCHGINWGAKLFRRAKIGLPEEESA